MSRRRNTGVLADVEADQMRALCESWLQECALELLRLQPAIAPAVLAYEAIPVVDERLPTAMTDGAALYFNPWFMATLSADERAFVYAHELWHILLRHHGRRAGRPPQSWNLACDHEVNTFLGECGFTVPDGAYFLECHPFQANTAEAAWDLLAQREEQEARERALEQSDDDPPRPRGKRGKRARSKSAAGAGAAEHDAANPTKGQGEQLGAGKAAGGNTDNTDEGGQGVREACPGPFVSREPSSPASPSSNAGAGAAGRRGRGRAGVEKGDSGLPSYMRPIVGQTDPRFPAEPWSPKAAGRLERLHEALRRALGSTPTGQAAGYRTWDVATNGKATLPWHVLLSQRLQAVVRRTERSWYPSRRHIHRGVYLPGHTQQPAWRLALAVDTSASTLPQWPVFVAELRALSMGHRVESIRYLECDDAVRRDEEFTSPDRLPHALNTLTGGGGTAFRPVFERLATAEVDALIYFSDGCGPPPGLVLPFPVLRVWDGGVFEGMG